MIKDFIIKNWLMIIIVILAIFVGYGSVFYLGKNNPIELEVEKIIEIETGAKIDLTP